MATVVPFDPALHGPNSYSRRGGCGQGGGEPNVRAQWSVTSGKGRISISSCDKHLASACRWVESQETALLRYEADRDRAHLPV